MGLKKPREIQDAYSDERVAEDYIDARFTSAWGSVIHAAQVKAVNDAIGRHRVARVLEIAPGPARLSREVTGFDRGYLCEFNDAMLQVAQRRLAGASQWTLVRGDGFHLPFGDQSAFDMVYTFRFIRHFEQADRSAIYRQIRRVLKSQGLLVFDAVNRTAAPAGADSYRIHDVLYTRETLIRELADNGFEPLSFTDVIRHMWLQYRLQLLVGPRADRLARLLIGGLEFVPGEPLEWVVVCRKIAD
jgi:ubiquinone/menaquinone biosynthesis C-methylase UbiE